MRREHETELSFGRGQGQNNNKKSSYLRIHNISHLDHRINTNKRHRTFQTSSLTKNRIKQGEENKQHISSSRPLIIFHKLNWLQAYNSRNMFHRTTQKSSVWWCLPHQRHSGERERVGEKDREVEGEVERKKEQGHEAGARRSDYNR